MPKLGQHENKVERAAAYRKWLEEHASPHSDWPREEEVTLQLVVRMMKQDGVVAKATGWRDVRQLPAILDKMHGVKRG